MKRTKLTKREAIQVLRKRLSEAMRIIANEHVCDDCVTLGGRHERTCKYVRTMLATFDVLMTEGLDTAERKLSVMFGARREQHGAEAPSNRSGS